MRAMQRLAIIDRGEPAMRCISAVAELNRESREHITTIALYTQDTASWIVREASEAMVLSPATFAGTGSYHSTRLDPVRLLAVLTAARADTLWAGWEFIAEPAELARLCETMLERHHSYVREHLEDMPEVRDWTWSAE